MSGGRTSSRQPKGPNGHPAVVVQKCYDLVLWLLKHIGKMPRVHRFTVGDRLATAALDVMNNLVAAAYSRDKLPLIEDANLGLHQVLDDLVFTKGCRA